MSVLIWTEGYARTVADPETDPWADDGYVERVRAQLAAEEAAPPRPRRRFEFASHRPRVDYSEAILAAAAAIEAAGGVVTFSGVARSLGRSLQTMYPHFLRLVDSGHWRWPIVRTGRPRKGA